MADVLEEISKFAKEEDLSGLNELVSKISHSCDEKTRKKIIEAYEEIFEWWMANLWMEKWSEDSRFDVISDLFTILGKIKALDPGRRLFLDRAQCYEQLAAIAATIELKLAHLDQAIAEYHTHSQVTGQRVDNLIAKVECEKLKAVGKASKQELHEIFTLLRDSLENNGSAAFRTAVFLIFDLHALAKVESPGYVFASLNAFLKITGMRWDGNISAYLDCNTVLIDVLRQFTGKICREDHLELLDVIANHLDPIKDYESTDTTLLNCIGHAFQKVATELNAKDVRKVQYCEQAVKFFTRAQTINPSEPHKLV
jgi:hypothetical protein